MRLHGRWRATAKRAGAAATELALLLPFLALLFFVAVDYCRVYHAAQVVDSAARSGAISASGVVPRDPAVSASDAATQAAIAEGAGLSPPVNAGDVSITINSGQVTVTVTYRFGLHTTGLGANRDVRIVRSVTLPVAPDA